MAIVASMPTVRVAPLTSTARAAVPARGFLGGTVGVVEPREVSVRVAAPTQYFFNGAAARIVETGEINLVSTMTTTCDVSPVDFWREVHGANDWEYLVQPLHPLLRREIVRYGEFVAACYKAFDLDPNSKRYLTCKYGKRSLLKEAGMGDSGYDVTKYIYVTPDVSVIEGNPRGRWMGYVAVSSDETVNKLGRRDVLICLRGTVTTPEWIANLMSFLTPARLDPHNPGPDVRVETGFLSLYTSDEGGTKFGLPSCREQLLSEVSRLVKKHKGEELSITIAGHSMGSSLGALLAYDITELGLNKTDSVSTGDIPVTMFSFGGPRVGNAGFKKRLEELGVKILRIVNVNDPITKMPGVMFNENTRVLGGMYELPWSGACYAHLGVEVVLNFFNEENPTCVHDIEAYVTLLKCQGKSFDDEITMDGDEFLLNVLSFLQNPGAIW